MNTTYIIVAVVLGLGIVGAILVPIFAYHTRSEPLHDRFGAEFDHSVETLDDKKKA